jgi:cytochrome c oxidase cbb3-type subunit III
MCSRFRDIAALGACALLMSCQQTERASTLPPGGALAKGNRQSTLQPGDPVPVRPLANPLEATEEIIGQGKELYNHFNCAGCHAAGGGAIGPPLMDDKWIYGSTAGNIFWTIIEGRPQGMPAFGGRIVDDQVWRIVAYVRSLSGLDKAAQASGPSPSGQGK